MGFEVVLLACGPHGVSLLGRSSQPDIVETVRSHLVSRLDPESREAPGPLRLVPYEPGADDFTEGESG